MIQDWRDRQERASRTRSARAHAHLERVRAGRGRRAAPRRGEPAPALSNRVRVGLWFAATLLGGALVGHLLVGPAASAWSDGPARIERIAVRGASHLAAEAVASATGVAPGQRFDGLAADTIAERLASHDWIASARALWLPGGTLLIEVRERVPQAGVGLGKKGEIWAVDERGAPFAPVAPETLDALPRLETKAELAPREPHEGLAEAVRLARRLPELGLARPAVVEVAAEDDPEGFALRFERAGARFVIGREDLDARLDQLAELLASHSEGLAEASSIDLRFADQVVLRMEPTPGGADTEAAARGDAASSNRRSPRSAQPSG